MRKANLSCNAGSASLYFISGVGLGLGLAVLLTPRSGFAARRLISRKVNLGEDWLKAKAAAAQEYVSTQGEKLGDQIKRGAETIGRNSSIRLREELESSSSTEPVLRGSRKRVYMGTTQA